MYSPAQEVPGTPVIGGSTVWLTDTQTPVAVVPADFINTTQDDHNGSVPGTPVLPRGLTSPWTPTARPSNFSSNYFVLSQTPRRTPRGNTSSPLVASLIEQVVPTTPRDMEIPVCVFDTPTSRPRRTVMSRGTQLTFTPQLNTWKSQTIVNKSFSTHVMDASGDNVTERPKLQNNKDSGHNREIIANFRRSPEARPGSQCGEEFSSDFLDLI